MHEASVTTHHSPPIYAMYEPAIQFALNPSLEPISADSGANRCEANLRQNASCAGFQWPGFEPLTMTLSRDQ